MCKKYTIEDVREFAKKEGYEVLDDTYVNARSKMKFKCLKCGYVIDRAFYPFKNCKNYCPNCQKDKCKDGKLHKYTPQKIKDFIKNKNFELIKIIKEKGVDSKILLKCNKCNHEFSRKFYNFKCNPTCPNCRDDKRRAKFEDIKNFVEIESKSGCKFLETKESYKEKYLIQPKMALCKLKFQCICGNEFEISFNTFKSANKRQCNECTYKATGMGMRYSYEDIKKYIEVESGSGCKLLSKTYNGNHKPLHLKCSCGNEFYRALSEFKFGDGLFKCKKCTGATIKYTYEEVYNDLKNHDVELLSKEYINYSTNMKIKYKCGFEVCRNYHNIKKSNYKCPHCIKKRIWKKYRTIVNGN